MTGLPANRALNWRLIAAGGSIAGKTTSLLARFGFWLARNA